MRYSLPDVMKPADIVFNSGHFEPSRDAEKRENPQEDHGFPLRVIDKLTRMFGWRAASSPDRFRKTPIQDIIVPKSSDKWGVILEGHGKVLSDSRPLTTEERGMALGLLFQLYQSAVTSATTALTRDRREVFFSPSRGWHGVFPQLRALWDAGETVCVFYATSLGGQFMPWAEAKPDNERLLKIFRTHFENLVVVVPAILPLDAELLGILKAERAMIWG